VHLHALMEARARTAGTQRCCWGARKPAMSRARRELPLARPLSAQVFSNDASATFQVQSTWVSRRHERLPQAAQQDGVTGTVLRSLMAQILEPLERRRRKRGKTQEDKDGALSDAYDGACSRHAAHPCLPFHPQRQSHHTVSTAHTIAIWVLSGIQSEILRCRGPLPRRRLLILVVVVCSTPQSL